ncbi:MAG: response regulator transcription factor [Chloroflexi bacterium]|nr:response regulator transcription factor [Chloroflexota bacterium]MYJ58242.1 response regulator transcription factor [Chloroflexota bacterium]
MPTPEPITVLVVDDHPIMRQGICDLLNRSERFSVVGEAADGEEALRMAAELTPQVVIMDVIMPRTDGIEACRELMAILPDIRVMMLTAAVQEDAVIDAIAAGASGFVEKYAPPEEFITAVSDVAAGRLRVPDEAVKRVFAMLRGERPLETVKPLERLTAIERETLTYFASGTPYGEIARQRGISVVTVRNTLYRIQDKLGIETKPELVIWAVRNGLVDDVVVGIDEQ